MTAKPPDKTSKSTLEAELDAVGIALLKSAYGHIVGLPEGAEPPLHAEINPAVFKAAVDWIRVKNKLEPDDNERSGIDRLRGKLGK